MDVLEMGFPESDLMKDPILLWIIGVDGAISDRFKSLIVRLMKSNR